MKRWLVRGGIALGVLVLLIVAFYVEENWRGARLWAATKAEYEAKGFSFDPKALIPTPIPDDQNFAATPIWKHLESYKKVDEKENFKVALFSANSAAIEAAKKSREIWLLGVMTTTPDPALFAGAETELADIYAAAEKPLCRFNIDYSYSPPYGMPLPQASSLMKLTQALRWHALIALSQSRPEVAAKDVSLSLRLASASMDEPLLIMGLVGVTSEAMASSVIWHGIESHAWTDEQLAQFEGQLRNMDLLRTFETDMRSELCLALLPMLDLMQSNPKKLTNFASQAADSKEPEIRLMKMIPSSFIGLIFNSKGACEKAKTKGAHFYIDQIIPTADSGKHRFFPERLPDFERIRDQRSLTVPGLMLALTMNGLALAPLRFGELQGRSDLAQVACGLERYWLVNKKYPATLSELEPKFIGKVPHDLCNGEPLHYRVGADGNYTLYSVGFNGTDDGGKIVMKKDSATAIDPKQGDWVWPRSAHPHVN